jgi:RNA polymerase sigma-70 factor (sigma-E family)
MEAVMTPERQQLFADFVAAHSRSLYGTAYLLTGNPDNAEDLVQETLSRLYPKWSVVAAADSPVAYVRRSLANQFISTTRTRAHRDLTMWDVPDRPGRDDVAADVADRSAVWHLLGTLPERQRAAIVLRYFHDQPDNEIANALACREATVRSLISRGVAAMRERLGRESVGSERS